MGNMLSCKTTSEFYHHNGNDERRLLDLHIGLHNFRTTKPPAPSHYHKPIHQPTTLTLQSWIGDIIIHMKSASDGIMIGAQMEDNNYHTKNVCEYVVHNQIQGGNCHPRIVCEKIMVNNQIEVVKKLICMPPASHGCQTKPISENIVENHGFEDLPEDVLCTIFSKLPLKEIVRTSVLSSKWRNLWTICPSLRLDGDVLCGQYDSKLSAPPFLTRQQYIQKFINIVNAILRQHRGMPIEELVVKFGIHSMLHRHLDNWISYAISSWTKKLTIDLEPATVTPMRYEMPVGLFDIECASRLQIIELRYVIFIPPPHFTGFPNLTKLELNYVHSTAEAIRDMLSHCHNLEWLGFVRCQMDGELKVDQPLSRLEYLKVKSCTATKVEFHAKKLRDFIYRPHIVPIDIRDSLELENVDVSFACMDVEYAVTVFPSQFPTVQSLSFSVSSMPLKFSRLFESSFKFLKLRKLTLGLFIIDDVNDNMIFLSSFLMAAPIIEELEMALFWRCTMYVGDGPFRSLSVRPYNYLKRMHVEGFTGSKGEFDFVLNTTENAPALEVLSIDPKSYDYVARNVPSTLEMIRENAKRVFDGKIPPKTTFHLL